MSQRLFSLFQGSKNQLCFPTDFKVTQDKSRKEDVLNKTPMELVVANVMKFDIFLPLVVFGVSPRGFFLTSSMPSQYWKSWRKPWFDSPLGTFFLNRSQDFERAGKML